MASDPAMFVFHPVFFSYEHILLHTFFHMQQHNDARNTLFLCDIEGCQQAFAHKWSLKRHMRTHLGHVTHSCNVCGLGFVQKCSRDRHQATHSHIKPHKCSFCYAAFKLPEYLKQHKLKTHAHILRDIDAFSRARPQIHQHELHVASHIAFLHQRALFAIHTLKQILRFAHKHHVTLPIHIYHNIHLLDSEPNTPSLYHDTLKERPEYQTNYTTNPGEELGQVDL